MYYSMDNPTMGLARLTALLASIERKKGEAPPVIVRRRKKFQAGRNEQCPCNSGKKFKKCCIDQIITEVVEPPKELENEPPKELENEAVPDQSQSVA